MNRKEFMVCNALTKLRQQGIRKPRSPMTRRPAAISRFIGATFRCNGSSYVTRSKAKSSIPSKKNVQKKPTMPKERETIKADNLHKRIRIPGLENLAKLREEGKLSDKEYLKKVREIIKAIVAHITKSNLEKGREAENRFVLPDLNLPYVDDAIP